jgi:phosphohistidine phosphatase
MKILIIRHAIAEKREDWNDIGRPDELRPLTKKGIIRFTQACEGLRKLIPQIDTIYSSELTRAIETTQILEKYYPTANIEITQGLNPDSPPNLAAALLSHHGPVETIAFVGHQPDLGFLLGQILNESPVPYYRFKKGGVACIETYQGMAQLQWLLTQKHLELIQLANGSNL